MKRQSIYCPFLSISQVLARYLEIDFSEAYKGTVLSLLPDQKFYTLGFLIQLLVQVLKTQKGDRCSENEGILKCSKECVKLSEYDACVKSINCKFCEAYKMHGIYGRCEEELNCLLCNMGSDKCIHCHAVKIDKNTIRIKRNNRNINCLKCSTKVNCKECAILRDRHWALSEAMIDSSRLLDVKGYNINETKVKLKEILSYEQSNLKSLPILFFDECQRDKSDKHFVEKYRFLRRLTRQCGFISIFMGTNASLANFVGIDQAGSSRTDKVTPWCYILHRLPAVAKEYLKREINTCFASLFCEKSLLAKDLIKPYLDVLVSIMSRERPLFCNLCFEFLKSVKSLQFIQSIEFNPLVHFQKMIDIVFVEFNLRKQAFVGFKDADFNLYNFANISLMSPEFWVHNTDFIKKEIIDDNSSVEAGKSPYFSRLSQEEASNAIHRHIAYLHVPSAISLAIPSFPFFGVAIGNKGELPIIGRTSNMPASCEYSMAEFKRESIFAVFKHETIGELAFVNKNSLKTIFSRLGCQLGDSSGKQHHRISTFCALKQSFIGQFKLNFIAIKNSANWAFFELAAPIAALLATHCNDIKGIAFENWLAYFCNELKSNSNFTNAFTEEQPYALLKIYGIQDNVWNSVKDINIPYCSASIKAPWDNKFAVYLSSIGGNLGVVHSDLKNAQRDFYIERFNTNNSVISGECKFRTDRLSKTDILEVIKKLSKFDSLINIIVTNNSSFLNCAWDFDLNKEFGNEIADCNIKLYYIDICASENPCLVYLSQFIKHTSSIWKCFIIVKMESLSAD